VPATARITVRLTPRAAREEIAGVREGALVVRVTAPPVDGAANEALVKLLAKRLGLQRGALRIVSGGTARTKVVEVDGIVAAEAWQRLGYPAGAQENMC
jgi:uncharacterized protein